MSPRRMSSAVAAVFVALVGCRSADGPADRPAVGHRPSGVGATAGPSSTGSSSTGPSSTVDAARSVDRPGSVPAPARPAPVEVRYRVESRVDDVTTEELTVTVHGILTDPRGWTNAGFRFVVDAQSRFLVVLAEPDEVDRLCLPLQTKGTVSCQNGPVVALNGERWRRAVAHWTLGTAAYRDYLVNHEVGHLIGQRHPEPICPRKRTPAAVMAQQTRTLDGCGPNSWPRPWEIALAAERPAVLAPLPDWAPGPPPANPGT